MHMCMRECVHTCMHTCMPVCVCVRVCVQSYMCTRMWALIGAHPQYIRVRIVKGPSSSLCIIVCFVFQSLCY